MSIGAAFILKDHVCSKLSNLQTEMLRCMSLIVDSSLLHTSELLECSSSDWPVPSHRPLFTQLRVN